MSRRLWYSLVSLILIFTVAACAKRQPPPRALVLLVTPSTVWSGTSTTITVFATNVAPPVARVRILPSGTTGPAIDLASVSAPADHADRPSAVVPAGTASGTTTSSSPMRPETASPWPAA